VVEGVCWCSCSCYLIACLTGERVATRNIQSEVPLLSGYNLCLTEQVEGGCNWWNMWHAKGCDKY